MLIFFVHLAVVERTVARLKAIRGIGEWTAQYIALRAVREMDAFPATDIGLFTRRGFDRWSCGDACEPFGSRRVLATVARLRSPTPLGCRRQHTDKQLCHGRLNKESNL